MSPTSYQAALPRVIPSLLSATLIIIPYSNGFVKRVRKVFLQRKQRMKTRLLTFFPESQQPRQFTPLREGRRKLHLTDCVLDEISIHAPPRGATAQTRTEAQPRSISIHAPPRGATDTARGWGRKRWKFQFTPLREGRLRSFAKLIATGQFQFTPLREGRRSSGAVSGTNGKFQFTPLREGRRFPRGSHCADSRFQFTPLREGRHDESDAVGPFAAFQFTPLREGRRPFRGREVLFRRISIHAPPRGATRSASPFASLPPISIHAPPRGATGDVHGEAGRVVQFQFTPLREGRQNRVAVRLKGDLFQFTPLREGRHVCEREETAAGKISIHAPPRGATVEYCIESVQCEFQFTPLREGRRQKICNFCKSFVQPLQISMA